MSRKTSRRGPSEVTRLVAGLGAIGLGLVASSGPSSAQGAADDGGVVFDLTLSQTVEASDNLDLEDPANSGFRSITSLDGSIRSITRSQSFVLGYSAAVELDDDGFTLGDTGVDAMYMRMGPGGELTLDARYFRKEITEEFQGDDLETIIASGTQIDYGYGARLLLGADGPLSLELSARQDEREFDSPDPDAVDFSTVRLSARASARLDPATTARATLNFTEREEDDAANQIESTTTAGLGVTRDLGNASSVSADVNWTRVAITETAIIRETTETTGIGGRLSYDRDLPNGSFTASAEREITENGPIDEFRLGREVEFPASSLFFEAGIVITDGDTVSPLLGVDYERELRDGALNLSVTQTAGVNSDDETVLSTRGNASWLRDINQISSLTAAVGVRNDSTIGGGGTTTRRVDASLTYRRQLTQTADLSAGYEYAIVSETGEADRQSNTLFVTVSQALSARP